VTPPERIPEFAGRLLKELNMLRKDSRDAGLDDPTKWRPFVSWDDLLKMSQEFRPRDQQIRAIIARIVQAKGQADLLAPLQRELSNVLNDLQESVRPLNILLVRQMTRKLDELVPDTDTELSPLK
jgi:hypothetical protein